nr:hypothetical protein [Tanacetum cinerariifolium]
MDTYTALSRRVEHLKLDKIAQALEITKLKRRVKKLERRNKGRMIPDIDADADVVLKEAKDVAADIAKADKDAKEEEAEPIEVQEVVDVVITTKLITKVVTAASTTIIVADVPGPAATTAVASTLTTAPRRRTKRVVDLSTYTTKYTSPALTQKVFANMRWVGKGFFRVEILLFEGMLVAQEVGEGIANEVPTEGVPCAGDAAKGDVSAANDEVPTADEELSIPSPTPPTPPTKPS